MLTDRRCEGEQRHGKTNSYADANNSYGSNPSTK
jgi:hypothetical protein